MVRGARQELSGWGRSPRIVARQFSPATAGEFPTGTRLARGLGRSYGDASLPAERDHAVVTTRRFDRLLRFDVARGLLRVEAGAPCRDIERIFLPRGWFLPVVPGTAEVTVGGMLAADVHGKNHHTAGTFGRHVRAFSLRCADGTVREVSRESDPELFSATVGGMGLTGIILEVAIQLERVSSPWIVHQRQPYPSLGELLPALRRASREWPFTVAWADALARDPRHVRGVLIVGRWAQPQETDPVPPRPPRRIRWPGGGRIRWVWTPAVALFNRLYAARDHWLRDRGLIDPYRFFHPLDALRNWNLLYGARGFAQYQCVLPDEAADRDGLALFEILRSCGSASTLTVIKDCGSQGEGFLSFPRPGISFAFDIPNGPQVHETVRRLNEHVIACGGRIYLAKDFCTPRPQFESMEPRLARWRSVRARIDPERTYRSALGDRLLDPPGRSP